MCSFVVLRNTSDSEARRVRVRAQIMEICSTHCDQSIPPLADGWRTRVLCGYRVCVEERKQAWSLVCGMYDFSLCIAQNHIASLFGRMVICDV